SKPETHGIPPVRYKGREPELSLTMHRRLTPYQELVLLAAAHVRDIPYYHCVPFGVYRGLLLDGLLARARDGFEITGSGQEALARHRSLQGLRSYKNN